MRASDAERLATWSDRFTARFAGTGGSALARMRPGLPRSIGSVELGEALLGGLYRMGGQIVDGAGLVLWDALPDNVGPLREAHGFGWLDDLAAVPADEAANTARAWTAAWIDRFGTGRGPGWVADLAGRRALRLIHHGEMLAALPLAPCLARHGAFLARRATRAAPGHARVEALCGLFHAILALDPADARAGEVLAQLDMAADALIGSEGGVQARSPEALAQAVLLIGWTRETALAHGLGPGGLAATLSRAAPVLRSLVQPDGCLPRFHGGGRAPGIADAALAAASGPRSAAPVTAMGFVRLRHGRTSLVLDAAAPPAVAGGTAHASTLAFEMTVGGQPMIVNCGPGERYGPRWRRAARATASHSTLGVDGYSSSRFGRDGLDMTEAVRRVTVRRDETDGGTRLRAAHDGYLPTHGLHHERVIELSRDGRSVHGEDALVAHDAGARRRFDRVLRRNGPVRFAIRFHLDPSVEASLDMGGRAVSLLLPTGTLWVFRVTGGEASLMLDPSVVFPPDALEPIGTKQVAVFSSAGEYATRLAWKLTEAPGGGFLAHATERRGQDGREQQRERANG